MTNTKGIMNNGINFIDLSKEIFWDVDYTKLDYDKSANWVICRVLDRGSLNDWKEMKVHYGIEKIFTL